MAVTTATQVTPESEPTGVERKDRGITVEWYVGERVPEGATEPKRQIAVLNSSHDSSRKCFYATLSLREDDGDGCWSYKPFDTLTVTREPVGRFSPKRLEAFHESAVASLKANANDPRVLAKFAGVHEMPNPRQLD